MKKVLLPATKLQYIFGKPNIYYRKKRRLTMNQSPLKSRILYYAGNIAQVG